ncbi:hypothetical protein I317_06060 [Kwoniella heveanensis CBS 569]|nr:hypothetical protein I317_06060 [Kwoniella heveanensis CBS 569]
MVSFRHLPQEILQRIILHIPFAIDHVRLPKVCSALARAYTARTYRALCVKYGFGRSNPGGLPSLYSTWAPTATSGGSKRSSDGNAFVKKPRPPRQSWRETFLYVVEHARTCRIEACSPHGLPAPDECWTPDHPCDYRFPQAPVSHKIHPFVAHLGNVNLHIFLSGVFSANPESCASSASSSFDDALRSRPTLDGRLHQPTVHKLEDHPILSSAFCCQPPAATVSIKMGLLMPRTKYPVVLAIYNKDGVTVHDVVRGLSKWFATRPSGMDLESFMHQRQALFDADGDEAVVKKWFGYQWNDEELWALMGKWHDCGYCEDEDELCEGVGADEIICREVELERHTYGDWYGDWIRRPALKSEPEAKERIMLCRPYVKGYVGMEITMITEERGRL